MKISEAIKLIESKTGKKVIFKPKTLKENTNDWGDDDRHKFTSNEIKEICKNVKDIDIKSGYANREDSIILKCTPNELMILGGNIVDDAKQIVKNLKSIVPEDEWGEVDEYYFSFDSLSEIRIALN
jgi:hypothetical protein